MGIVDRKLMIYLAGKMSGLSFQEMNEWRVAASSMLLESAELLDYRVKVINPVDYYNYETTEHQSEKEVEDFDLRLATSSDLILVNVEGLNTSIGTIIELHDCNYHKRIPVISFGDTYLYEQLHPWVSQDITRHETSLQGACHYIQNYYMI